MECTNIGYPIEGDCEGDITEEYSEQRLCVLTLCSKHREDIEITMALCTTIGIEAAKQMSAVDRKALAISQGLWSA
jgi:hypothetical protein